MQRLFTITLTAAVLVHATLGCCLHHAHSAEVGCCDTLEAKAEVCACDGHEGHRELVNLSSQDLPDDSDPQQRPHGPNPCESDQCSFARTESSRSSDSLNTSDLLAVLVCPVTSVTHVAECCLGRTTSFDLGVPSSTLRRHLVLAVLLI